MWFVTIMFWLQVFTGPVIVFGIIGLATGNENLLYVLLVIGSIGGIILAEYIRRRFGLDTFFGRIFGPNEMDEILKEKKVKNGTKRTEK